MKRLLSLIVAVTVGCATTGHHAQPARIFKSAANPVGSIDFFDTSAGTAPTGITRLARVGGTLMQSADGSAYAVIGGGGGAPVTASGVPFPQDWNAAVLAAFQAVNSQLTEPAFPVFDFMEGTLAASRTGQTLTGTGTAVITQSPPFGIVQIGIGSGTGNVEVYPANTPAMNGSFSGVPIATAARVEWTARTISSNTGQYPACLYQINFSQLACVGITTLGSSTNFSLVVAGSGGPAVTVVATAFPIPPLNVAEDIGIFWDGGRFIAFAGDALSGTFVPDLVNTVSYVGSLVGGLGAAMPLVRIADTVTTVVYLDKLNGYMGVLQ